MTAKLEYSIPSLPVRNQEQSTVFYRDILGFSVTVQKPGFTKLSRDQVELHLWIADDESWRERAATDPVMSGAESFIAGTQSCRIAVVGVDELYGTIQRLGIIPPDEYIADTPWNTREFGVLDPDGNLITFFER